MFTGLKWKTDTNCEGTPPVRVLTGHRMDVRSKDIHLVEGVGHASSGVPIVIFQDTIVFSQSFGRV